MARRIQQELDREGWDPRWDEAAEGREESRDEAEVILPQSSAQQRLFFLHAYEPDDAGYNIVGAYRLRGPLDVDALRASLLDLERRHPALRATFHMTEDGPVQAVGPPGRLRLQEATAEPRELPDLVAVGVRRTLGPEGGTGVRALLVHAGAQDRVLVLVIHHIVCDQRSWQLLLAELRQAYAAHRRREPSPLPAPSVSYEDYLRWERQQLTDDVLDRQLAYWKRRLAALPPRLDLSQRAEPAAPTPARPVSQAVDLPAEVLVGARVLASEESTTPFVVYLALCAATLARRLSVRGVVVGCPVSTRDLSGSDEVVGFFVNLVVIRVTLLPEDTLRTLVRQAREAVIDALDNSKAPYQEVVAHLTTRRDRAQAPLFEVSFNLLDEAGDEGFTLDGLEVSPYAAVEPGVRHTLSLVLTSRAGSAELRGVFDAAELPMSLVEELLASYRGLARLLLRAPERAVV
jgi:hypothetical protein